jgi:CheY-like chemotaxis protein
MFLATSYFEEVMSMTDSYFPASNRTIMVIDDERELVAVVRNMLEEKGFNVTCAYIGLELFASLKKQMPDLILLDTMMPQMDGLKVLTHFKEDPSMPFIPVILLTEKADDEDVMVGYKMGADYYLTKPFTKNQLLDGVNSILS